MLHVLKVHFSVISVVTFFCLVFVCGKSQEEECVCVCVCVCVHSDLSAPGTGPELLSVLFQTGGLISPLYLCLLSSVQTLLALQGTQGGEILWAL